jgi:iron complex transport system substrate-binding protein
LALKADAVFSWGYLAGPLERAGVPHVVEVSSNAANRRTSELNAWRAIGAVTGHASRVRTLIAADDAVRHDIALRVAARGSHVRRPTYVLLSLSRRFGGSGIYLAELPAFAGFALAPAAGTFTLEKLLAADPDVILIDQNLDPDTPAALAAQPGWDAVRAVREHRVYVLPAHSLFDGAVDDRVLLPWLDEVAHLGTVHDNVRADVAALYRDVFGRTASAADIDVYLSSRVNRSSVGVP